MNLFFSTEINDKNLILSEDEFHHCTRVLRLPENHEAGVLDGKGNLYTCRLTEIKKDSCDLKIIKKDHSKPDPFNIHIAIAPTKSMERIEWFIEKAVELGIHEISFIRCARSERKEIKIERLDKIVINALKQSQNRYLPVLNKLIDYKTFTGSADSLAEKFIAHISSPEATELFSIAKPRQKYLLMIGPEGDFDQAEIKLAIENKFIPVSLGKSRLRTETAGLAGLHTLVLINRMQP